MSTQTKPVFTRILTLNLIALALLSGCDGNSTSSPAAESKAVVSNSTTQQQDLKAFFESAYKENLVRSPMTMEIRGDKSANDRWDDWSEAFAAASQAIRKQQRNTLQQYPHAALSAADRLSFDIFDYEAAMAEEGYRFRYYDYPVNQMFGIQAAPITHLMNVHKLATVADAEAYIARLQRLPILFDQVIAKLQASAKQGIVAPRFALQLAAEQMRGLLTGTPFQPAAAQEHVILADFTKKLATLELQASEQQALIARAEQALVDAVKQYTTTDMTPEQVHQLGWSEIRRLHGEIQTIMDKLGFSGDLHSFFHFTQEDPQFFYSKNDAGRARALADAENFISGFTAQLDDWFLTQPKASLEVKPVEAFREATSPVAFYNAGSPDGERAGIYYLNLFEPREMPIWQMALLGEDPASQVYVRNKVRQAKEVGINSMEFRMLADTAQETLLQQVRELNNDPAVNGILVQLPLPAHIDEAAVTEAIAPEKDVDGFHAINAGRLMNAEEGALVPCTPQGCIMLAKQHLGDNLSGKHAVVVGRSNIVGKPVAMLLLQENCTVTVAHSRTQNLPALCKSADILVAAVGRAEMIKGGWIKPGATVIDVGINRIETEAGKSRLVGDVAYHEALEVAGGITPVPGGVGPMTIACLLQNTLLAACRQSNIKLPDVEEATS